MDLSIIIPVYNVEPYLEACVASVYRQSLPSERFEVILINDGSTDDSFRLMQKLAAEHPNMRVVDQKNCGLSAVRNRGVRMALGTYVLFVDSDDFLYDNTVIPLLDKAIANKLDVLRFDYWAVDEAGNRLFQSPYLAKRSPYEGQAISGTDLFEKIYNQELFAWLSLIKKDLLLQKDVFFEEGMFFEDIEFSLKVALKASRCMYISSCVYAYRQRPASILHTFSKKKVEDVVAIAESLQQYLKDPSLKKSVKTIIKQIRTHLIVSVLLRISDTPVYKDRRELLELMKKKGIVYLHPVKRRREFIVSMLYNLLGKYVMVVLYPVSRARLYLLNK